MNLNSQNPYHVLSIVDFKKIQSQNNHCLKTASDAHTLTPQNKKTINPAQFFSFYCQSRQDLLKGKLKKGILSVISSGKKECEQYIFKSFEHLLNVFDPKQRLNKLASENKISQILGNSNLEDANVILLSDHCHSDKEHSQWRGEIANAVKRQKNLFLVEALDSKNTSLSMRDKQRYLPSSVCFHNGDTIQGWDNKGLYDTSKVLLTRHLEKGKEKQFYKKFENLMNCKYSLGNFYDLLTYEHIFKEMNKQLSRIDRISDLRTNHLCQTLISIAKEKKYTKNHRIIVVGGAGHLLDNRLIKKLMRNGIKFVSIKAKAGKAKQRLKNSTYQETMIHLRQYYGVDKHQPSLTTPTKIKTLCLPKKISSMNNQNLIKKLLT